MILEAENVNKNVTEFGAKMLDLIGQMDKNLTKNNYELQFPQNHRGGSIFYTFFTFF